MKEEGRYEVYKQKHIVHCEKHRATQREIEKALPETLRREFVAKRREDGRRRVAQYRARKKQIASETQTSLMIEDSLESGKKICLRLHLSVNMIRSGRAATTDTAKALDLRQSISLVVYYLISEN